ncbi:MAG: hypothetical protein A2289_24540 [Deltaproteobacteria bacterium RIFOXYA12_FULL_58_15]|nr:MAG: hypothetical protein A2289_24540 [Deltaproteobacteria bacterium RIFOXYA12_FULL_58_15]OGR12722.1 MAG: hypothetical protein A2341_07880 [Deltaproteobacteria bacterium RIFOXYB12_FULL_58_9]
MHNKTALVTGGSRGIGLAVVERLKSDGYRVAATATRLTHLDVSLVDLPLECDVSDKQAVDKCVDVTVDEFGRIDLLVNNAGVAGSNPLEPTTRDDLWHHIINVNLHGTYYVTKKCLPHMPDHTGRIVNMGSVLSFIGVPDQTAYTAAKHGVLGFTRALALHLADRHITVNIVCPGWVKTDMAKQRWVDLGMTEHDADESTALGKVVEPHEVADLVAYLASESAASITGQSFTIDGGSLA